MVPADAAPCGGCGSQSACSCYGPKWGVRAGALALFREKPDSAVLFANPLNAAEQLDASEFDFDFQAGFEVSIMRRFDRWPDIEFRYMGVDGWTGRAGAVTTTSDPLAINTAIPVFLPTGRTIDAEYGSELESYELNLRSDPSCGRITWLAGFRYLELDESLHADLVDAVTPAPTVRLAAGTRNRLYGGQVGAEVKLLEFQRLRLDVTGKAGIYGNDNSQNALLDTGVVTVAAAQDSSSVSFVGEAHVVLLYCLAKNVSLRASYGVLGITDAALASDQIAALDFFTGSGINDSGNAFYHGGFLGLDFGY
jgi:hypothetical protein